MPFWRHHQLQLQNMNGNQEAEKLRETRLSAAATLNSWTGGDERLNGAVCTHISPISRVAFSHLTPFTGEDE